MTEDKEGTLLRAGLSLPPSCSMLYCGFVSSSVPSDLPWDMRSKIHSVLQASPQEPSLVITVRWKVSRETCVRFVGNREGQDRNYKGTIELRCAAAPGSTAVFQAYHGSHQEM